MLNNLDQSYLIWNVEKVFSDNSGSRGSVPNGCQVQSVSVEKGLCPEPAVHQTWVRDRRRAGSRCWSRETRGWNHWSKAHSTRWRDRAGILLRTSVWSTEGDTFGLLYGRSWTVLWGQWGALWWDHDDAPGKRQRLLLRRQQEWLGSPRPVTVRTHCGPFPGLHVEVALLCPEAASLTGKPALQLAQLLGQAGSRWLLWDEWKSSQGSEQVNVTRSPLPCCLPGCSPGPHFFPTCALVFRVPGRGAQWWEISFTDTEFSPGIHPASPVLIHKPHCPLEGFY